MLQLFTASTDEISRNSKLASLTTELSYNDLDLCETSFITLYILWYQLISNKASVFVPILA